MDEVKKNLARLEKLTGKKFGDTENPLLVSVRSGAAVSMPGMMDTVLNLGLNDRPCRAYIAMTGNERFAWDSYRRLINMFGDVVMGIDHEHFEAQIRRSSPRYGVELDTDSPPRASRALRRLQEGLQEAHRRRLPAGSARAAPARHRGGLQELERPARQSYRQHQQDHRPARHGRQRPDDGLRQHGR
jgi:pyruvate,orthophosphate dikinase